MRMPFRTNSLTTIEELDPVERYVPLLFSLGVYAFLTVFLLQAMDAFVAFDPNKHWPGLLFVVRTLVFLPLHEGGHFLNMLFGRTLYALGGSFWQVIFPLLWAALAFRQRSQAGPFALFWVGENLMDVSLYVRDAPFRVLPLLGGGKSGHDWNYLLSRWDAMDSAGTIADIAYFGGVVICAAAIASGAIWAIVSSLRRADPSTGNEMTHMPSALAVEDMLDETLKEKELHQSL